MLLGLLRAPAAAGAAQQVHGGHRPGSCGACCWAASICPYSPDWPAAARGGRSKRETHFVDAWLRHSCANIASLAGAILNLFPGWLSIGCTASQLKPRARERIKVATVVHLHLLCQQHVAADPGNF